MTSNAYQKILEHYETFSIQQKKAADYIMSNMDEVIYYPISKFAGAIGVSQATIVRFAQHLEYRGFNEFRNSLFEYYREHISPANRIKHTLEVLDDGSSTYGQIVKREFTYLEKSISTIEEEVLSKAVDKITSSGTIYIFAIGANEHLGCYLKFKLRRLKINCCLVRDSGREIFENLLMISPDDAAIIYNFANPSIDFNRVMEFLSDKDITSILITDIRTPSVIRLATYILYAERGPQGTFQSPVVPMTITNTLFLRIAEKMEHKAVEALGELGKLRDDYFYNPKLKH